MTLPEFSRYDHTTLLARRLVAADQIEVELEAPAEALSAFQHAGQFVRVRLARPSGPVEGIFAMLSAPAERRLRFLVRTRNPEGGEAADELAALVVGSKLEVTLPAGGGFGLGRARGRNLHFVATGTAIAPIRAAIEEALALRREFGELSLDHGLRSLEHLAVGSDVERWRASGVDVRLHYSSPAEGGAVVGVRVQDAALEQIRDFARAAFVVAGQGSMVRELEDLVVPRGALVLQNY